MNITLNFSLKICDQDLGRARLNKSKPSSLQQTSHSFSICFNMLIYFINVCFNMLIYVINLLRLLSFWNTVWETTAIICSANLTFTQNTFKFLVVSLVQGHNPLK